MPSVPVLTFAMRARGNMGANVESTALAPAGLMFLAITSIGWGFNWPVAKYLLGDFNQSVDMPELNRERQQAIDKENRQPPRRRTAE